MLENKKSLNDLANRLHFIVQAMQNSILNGRSQYGLTEERLSILSILSRSGPQTINSLAMQEQVSAPAITRTVKSLEKQGYVIKSRSKTDQRVVYVAPTRKTQQLLDDISREDIKRIESIIESLGGEDAETVHKAVAIIEQALNAQDK